MSQQLYYEDATELARMIRDKEVSPVEVLQAHLYRIEEVNPRINAIVALVENAMEQAKEAEAAVVRGDSLGSLHGVPFTIKDCVDTAGVRTTRGSRLYEDYVPSEDATVVARLKQAGGIFMAKTNMPEFAFWGETDNLVFGRTVNPWNFERTAGGSSGGEAAAIAAGLSPIGIGSDVGGSIRGPAHYCGITGIKATHGRVPLTGHWPDTLLRAMHVGPMARTVRDVALGLQMVVGPDGADNYAPPVPVDDYTDLGLGPSGLKIGWSLSKGFGPIEPDVRDTVTRAATALGEAGFNVEEVSLPVLESMDTLNISLNVYSQEAGLYLEPIIDGRQEELSTNIKRRLATPIPTLRQHLEGLRDWELLKQGTAAYFGAYDLLLCPTMPVPAHAHDITDITIDGQQTVNRLSLGPSLAPPCPGTSPAPLGFLCPLAGARTAFLSGCS